MLCTDSNSPTPRALMSQLNFEQLTVLVIDDSKPMHAILRTILGAMRIKDVIFCSGGEEAQEELRARLPDIIISDWVMEPMSGYDLVKWVRQDENSPNPYIPIIVLTAYSDESEILKARDVGVTEILAKPLSVETLHHRIEMIVDRPRPFVKSSDYFGPDRRRQDKPFEGEDRRKGPADVEESA